MSQRRPAPGILTPRERQCLALAAMGLTPGESGRRLGLSASTVVYHMGNAYRQLRANCLVVALRKTDLWGMADDDLERVATGQEVAS